ncbi:hypothetical protein LTR56_017931 [Elasticomyces elasticus]|nr:hypothetical protein LTR56_017931 [Elasticomyces elasticus]KAK3647218.1 hypothetical protein LTR22_013879 [Elasticomyces elasticus]KAK4913834.1 hypothetical protein LTR49_017870 [Elasticomyces elasticus]KAK5752917.1 hypothetical protein LTS12_016989 [Elasticomyces elasticus]
MDSTNQQPQQRDIVFCHQCEDDDHKADLRTSATLLQSKTTTAAAAAAADGDADANAGAAKGSANTACPRTPGGFHPIHQINIA